MIEQQKIINDDVTEDFNVHTPDHDHFMYNESFETNFDQDIPDFQQPLQYNMTEKYEICNTNAGVVKNFAQILNSNIEGDNSRPCQMEVEYSVKMKYF